MSRTLTWDLWIFVAALCLTVFGVIMVGSASSFVAAGKTEDPYYFVFRQGMHAALGLALMLGVMHLPHRWLARRGTVFLLIGVVTALLLGALLTPSSHGAHRWITAGPFNFQPSELAKIVLVVFLAYMIERKGRALNEWSGSLVPTLAVGGWLMVLVLIAPDFGTTVIMAMVAGAMLFAAGLRWRWILLLGGSATGLLAGYLFLAPYRRVRLLAFLDVLRNGADAQGEHTYHLVQSLVAVGSGGLWGTRLTFGQQKAFFLPEPFTDFIFAVIGEELGLVGCAAVIAVFLVLLWRGLALASRTEDVFGSYLALGLTILLVGQALVNVAVVVGLLPTKGLTLPFISYGGSSLICTLLAVGLLLSVSRSPAR